MGLWRFLSCRLVTLGKETPKKIGVSFEVGEVY
jgi:hypothetical protein